ncbi:unnamed protein product [Echinostoma caproni]|uniref:PWWP domain-containing protein n=1 Tax=Echinostoma caproni TaxID=27848 RepID=A0A183AJN0_9TREM|nr:unnamed protein product [Echinostoma caproni]
MVSTYDKLVSTWVECCFCMKWRYLPDVHDPSEICSNWHCALQLTHPNKSVVDVDQTDSVEVACTVPQGPTPDAIKDEFIYTQFSVGSVVWAKIQGYPAWPAMIYYNQHGQYAEYDQVSREVTHYHVVFLDPTRSTVSRVNVNRVRKFHSVEELKHKRGVGWTFLVLTR